jgi:hypothetical protein
MPDRTDDPLESRTEWCEHSYVTQVYVSPYRGAVADGPRCDFCDRAPVAVSARRDGAFGSALFCADRGRRSEKATTRS